VLELARLYPGPMAGMMLADMSADVIKIEDPDRPDPMRGYPPFVDGQSAGYLAVNRNKRSLALNLNSERGQGIFWDLVKRSDVVLEGFRPGVLDEAGLGYEAARKVNPRIVYVSLTGYGQTGPYARAAGHDLNYVGYTGLLGAMAGEAAPVPPPAQVADTAGGAYLAVTACLAALWSRERTGAGQRVDVAMLDGALPLMTLQLAHHWAAPSAGPLMLSGGVACYGIYRCKDGRCVALGALEPKFWKAFCEMAERPDWVSRQFDQGERRDALVADMNALFAAKTRAAWLALAKGKDVCLTPVLSLDEVASDPHLKARGMIQEVDGVRTVGPPLKFSGHADRGAARSAPPLGADTAAILRELGFDADERDIF